MNPLEHCRLMVSYSLRMNRQVFEAAGRLTPAQFAENRGAFFGSLLGTLNHLMVADLLWLARIRKCFPQFTALAALDAFPAPRSLDQQLHEAYAPLWAARQQLDAIVAAWITTQLTAAELAQDLDYLNMKGVRSRRNFGEVLMHLFNHQTHHRGQATTLLAQFGQDVGITDFLIDIPDREVTA